MDLNIFLLYVYKCDNLHYSTTTKDYLEDLDNLVSTPSSLVNTGAQLNKDNAEVYTYTIETTPLRQNLNYVIYYIYWTRLFAMGILPTILLIYFNYKVRKSRLWYVPL